ncbi:MAG TPA: hypothetical protein VM345_07980 [Acidimicrobiales bacterium]|jgi:hypothetical protein|nr:hypothetical protein [Acidimicrobiales bacterium]
MTLIQKTCAAAGIVVAGLIATAAPASAHAPHHVKLGNGGQQVLANGVNHGFVDQTGAYALFCVDAGEAPNSGHTLSGAMYGLENAHHGPDVGTAGRADGCYATTKPITDTNPAID